MKQIKNKKTGRIIEYLTEERYKQMLQDAPKGFMSRFEVTDLISRPIIPSIKKKK